MAKRYQMMARECCGNCIYYREAVNADGSVRDGGECLLQPPVVIVVDGVRWESVFPAADPYDWCSHQSQRGS